MSEAKTIDQIVRLGFLFLLVGMSLMIVAPFLILLLWAVIIAVALFPLFRKTSKLFGEREWAAISLFVIITLIVVVIPSFYLTKSTFQGFQNLKTAYLEGSLTIPAPTEDVKSWPIVGQKLYNLWDLASHNLRQFINENSGQLKQAGSWLLGTITNLSLTVLQFIVALIISFVFLVKAEPSTLAATNIARRLLGDKADEYVKLITLTIRSVVQGILGIAFIQGIGTIILLLAFGIPFASLWSIVVFVLAIIQLPIMVILGPIIVYVFSIYDTLPAVVFTILAVVIGLSDNILKPFLLGRGLEIPMLVILIGAIGGMLAFGILGLFVGSVILAVSYKLFTAWIKPVSTT